ncbi:serine hydrolase [Streptomyces sp. BE147]|nr:serine hydrolase [Streptomyces sp. BE147]
MTDGGPPAAEAQLTTVTFSLSRIGSRRGSSVFAHRLGSATRARSRQRLPERGRQLRPAESDSLARQALPWPPGATYGYHALIFGWLVGEVLRRVTGLRPS